MINNTTKIMITQKFIDSVISLGQAEHEMIQASNPAGETYPWEWTHVYLTKCEEGGYEHSMIFGSAQDKPVYFGEEDVYVELVRYHSQDQIFVVLPAGQYISNKGVQLPLPRVVKASFIGQEPEYDLRNNPDELLSMKPVSVVIDHDGCAFPASNIPIEWIFSDMLAALEYSAQIIENEIANIEKTLSLRKQELAHTQHLISINSNDKHQAPL